MRWTHRSEHRLEAGSNICCTMGSRVFPFPNPRAEQLYVHELSGHFSHTDGHLDQIKSVLTEKWKWMIGSTNHTQLTKWSVDPDAAINSFRAPRYSRDSALRSLKLNTPHHFQSNTANAALIANNRTNRKEPHVRIPAASTVIKYANQYAGHLPSKRRSHQLQRLQQWFVREPFFTRQRPGLSRFYLYKLGRVRSYENRSVRRVNHSRC